MDDIKDTKGDGFSRFIEAQQLRTDPFGKNRAAERLYRRVERLCAALYLLTRHISEDEPLRLEIRSESIGLLEKVLRMRDEMRVSESRPVEAFEVSVRRLISLVRILTAAGRISFQNADVVIGALDELTVFVISSKRSNLSETVVIEREDIVGDASPLRDQKYLKDVRDTRRSIKDSPDKTDTLDTSASSRAQGIVSILRGTGALGIKEIAARLPDYSEKMIQRELAALVKNGQVKKEGFKRWSKYALAQ
jgi:hypothetical protein